ncbi:phospholipase D family protein [Methylobacter sp. YRD-M1]|uniref:phospholipase D family protein n=1 Tax=Methylobacter sp. YRD-M1 TaxID=2911520 RepID=UPI00227B0A0E|nr:phospholipase D family protein [Methylobacter sp. YRD-M1]WAK00324.1 phospholipase D family protein [Methylobacter sp. YRD-M1]
MTGILLLEALRAAADRGVRVRLLLDDSNISSDFDTALSSLDAHPNIEVRLFNPFMIRKPRIIGYLTDFSRLNRRMHNKSFTADNRATIIGGRNVGDEYFGATEGVLFADLDVMAVGSVVKDVSNDFDRYWASESSYPVGRVLPHADPDSIEVLALAASMIERDPAAVAYMSAIRNSAVIRKLVQGGLPFEWAAMRMISDDPGKGLGQSSSKDHLTYELNKIIGEPKAEVELVSPYFVPTSAGVDAFVAMANQGVKIRIFTNSLEATDVPIVHAGYAKWRKPMLKSGIILYEMRRSFPEAGRNRRTGILGSSGSSLHAKTFSVDHSSVFIGSFNFDPRSARLNTELGFIIDSPKLAQQIDAVFNSSIPENAYEVCLSDDGKLYWLEKRNGKPVRHDVEPGTNFWQRAMVSFLSMLPIEWLL